jgi:hypothetical protein
MSSTTKILAAAAAPAPKVAFVGDRLNDSWSATLPANWIDYDQSGGMAPAIAQKPSLIHIMIGSALAWDDDATYNLVTGYLEESLIQDITQAQAAGIPVIVGIEPVQFIGLDGLPQMDIILDAVATKYRVPIVNYSGAFSNAMIGYGGTAYGTGGTAQGFGTLLTPTSNNALSVYSPSPAGYAVMTMMAQTAFATVNAQPKSLYLQDTLIQGNECSGCSQIPNVNTVSPGNTVQLYPVISYTNGVTQQAGFNVNFLTGSIGTWTSSNPLVGFVNQSGEFWAFDEGTTTVKLTLPNGVWNEWSMYVGAPLA